MKSLSATPRPTLVPFGKMGGVSSKRILVERTNSTVDDEVEILKRYPKISVMSHNEVTWDW